MTLGSRALAVIAVIAVGCKNRSPGGSNDPDASISPAGLVIDTAVSPVEVEAGVVVSVQCAASRDGQPAPDEPTTIEVSPAASVGATSFVATVAATYAVRCRSASFPEIVDPSPAEVIVHPAAPAAVDTLLAATTAQAGAPVAVSCAVYDAFANLVPEPGPTALLADPELLVEQSSAGHAVRGTLIGDYEVACSRGALSDTTPAALSITVGIPGRTETQVTPDGVRPGETASVSCAVTDEYGNPLTGVAASFVVLAADGASAEDSGLTRDAAGFSATRAGDYYVFCAVPGHEAGDESPAVVTVRPGAACAWSVELLAEDCYAQGRALPLAWWVYDCFGNAVDDAQVELTATPASGVELGPDGRYVLTDEADYDLALTLVSEQDPTSTITPYVTSVRVDSTPPRIDITSPARAAMLQEGFLSSMWIPVSGTVWDAVSPIASFTFDGQAQSVSGSDTSVPVSASSASPWGLAIIEAGATDACGNRAVLVQSYLRSPAYYPPSTVDDAAARAPLAVVAHMKQTVIDDGDRSDLDDLATMGEYALQQQDFNTLIAPGQDFASDPLSSTCDFCDWWADTGYLIERHPNAARRITWAGPWLLGFTVINGGVIVTARIDDFSVPLHFWAADRECACGVRTQIADIDVDGYAGASRVDASGALGITVAGGAPSVTVSNMTVNAGGLFLDLDCGWADFLCDGFTSLVLDMLESTIEDALADALADMLPPLVADFLSGFTLDSGFALPEPFTTQLDIGSTIDRILFCGPQSSLPKPAQCPSTSPSPGWGQIGLAAQIRPSARGASIPAASRGAIRLDLSLPSFPAGTYELGMALRDDLLNQIFWALWYGGALDLPDLTTLVGDLGFAGIELSFSALLPPVMMRGTGDSEVIIGLGDAYVRASVDLGVALGSGAPGESVIEVGMLLSTLVGGAIDIDPTTNELLVSLDPDPRVLVQIVDIDDPSYQAAMSDLFTGLLRLLLPELLGRALGAFPIPEMDLSGVGGLPAGTVFRLSNASIKRASGYYQLTGDLQ